MTKETFPAIGDEIRSAPRPKLDVALKPRRVADEAIDEGARKIGEKWGSVTQLPTSEPPQDRSKWPSVRFECPPYLDRELTIAAAQRGHTKTYLILKLLSENGFTVLPEDLVEDKRKQRR